MPFFLVHYVYTDDTALRDRVRPEHRRFTAALFEQGHLRASGPVPGTDEAYLLMVGDSADQVEQVLADDPFRRQGAVARRTVVPWKPVTGMFADEA